MSDISDRLLARQPVGVAGNVLFPAWRFSRLPDGHAAPADAWFVATMAGGLLLYLSLATAVLALGALCCALGRVARAMRPDR